LRKKIALVLIYLLISSIFTIIFSVAPSTLAAPTESNVILWNKLEPGLTSEYGTNGRPVYGNPAEHHQAAVFNDGSLFEGIQRVGFTLWGNKVVGETPKWGQDEITIEFWVKPDIEALSHSYGDRYVFTFRKGSENGYGYVRIAQIGDAIKPEGICENSYSGLIISSDEFTHIAISISTSEFNFYVNNELKFTSNLRSEVINTYMPYELLLGGGWKYNDWDWFGEIDNIKVFDYAKTDFSDRFIENIIFYPDPISPMIDIDPDTLNLNSPGKWITCYIELPEGYDVADVDISTILLNDVVPAETHPTSIDDYDEDGIPDLMVKFNRQDVIDIIESGYNVEITVSGELTDETMFKGTDYIKVISLEDIIVDIEDLVVPPGAEKKINKAIKELNKAVDEFNDNDTEKALGKIEKAVKHLMKAQDKGEDTQAIIDDFVELELVRAIVDDALEDAIERVGADNSHVVKAQQHYNKYLDKITEGKYDKAVKELKTAYKEAMKARGEWVPGSFIAGLEASILEVQDLQTGEITPEALSRLENAEDKLNESIQAVVDDKFDMALDKIKQAVKELEKAIDEGVDDAITVIESLLKNIEDTVYQKITDAESIVGSNNRHIIEAWDKFDDAIVKWDEGDYDKAINTFKEAAKKAKQAIG